MKKINTHNLLHDYHGRKEYSEIAKFAANLAKDGLAPEVILNRVAVSFPSISVPGMKATAKLNIWGTVGKEIPTNAHDQMITALSIEPALGGVLLPDAHYGYSCPIGGVVALENAVSPWYVGVDISCMMMLTIFSDQPESNQDFIAHRKDYAQALRLETRFGVGSAFNEPKDAEVMSDPRWEDTSLLRGLKPKAQKQLGSSGGGNHFADLVTGTFTEDTGSHKQGDKFTALMTHSGSRGPGAQVASHYMKKADVWTNQHYDDVPKQYGWLELDTELGQEYWNAMQLMGEYAYTNHALIHEAFLRAKGLEDVESFWNRHNFAWDTGKEIVHRKGATPAGKDVMGIIPGSSGANSYLVRGLGNQDSYQSTSHGAGRPHSRTQAKKQHDENAFKQHMQNLDVLYYGVAPDETSFAYKDIDAVIDLQKGSLLESIAVMKPSVVIMGGGIKRRKRKRK
ncbi:MAG: RtcB family protein [Chloroflexota bacterium]